jgi:FkbM family methyltransferase
VFNLDEFDIANKDYGSEYSQDMFALCVAKFKKYGFFVEIGVADGQGSNTYRLEKYFNWSGILIEAHPVNFSLLEQSQVKRTSTLINMAVSNKSGNSLLLGHGGTASLYEEYSHDSAADSNLITTDTLDNILQKFNAPPDIDYISIDTEGSELDIISAFSFNYDVKCFSIEVKTEHVDQLDSIMQSKCYVRVLEPFSDIDAWYIKQDIYDQLFKEWKK